VNRLNHCQDITPKSGRVAKVFPIYPTASSEVSLGVFPLAKCQFLREYSTVLRQSPTNSITKFAAVRRAGLFASSSQ